MADSRSNPNSGMSTIPSNNELINSLVSGLEECVVKEETTSHGGHISTEGATLYKDGAENSKSGEVKNGVTDSNSGKLSPTPNDEDILSASAEDEESLPTHEDDLIDELALKDLELIYTEEDRERLHKEAEVFKQSGNDLFKSGQFRESALAYTQALRTCPLAYDKDRAIFYSNRAAAKMKLELNEAAIEDCTKALELNESYLKALFRRAQLYEATEKLDEALADYNKILAVDPLHRDALYASKRLPGEINERNEKLKTEMLGKLKELGNMVLKPFGLSTENFQMAQDPSSGGYSINFKN